MKRRTLAKWRNIEETNGLLFFVQRIDEMLFHYSLDTYKTPVQNTKSLILEYLLVYRDVKSGLLKNKNEVSVFEELCWSLASDSAAQKIIGDSTVTYFLNNHGSMNDHTKKQYCEYFRAKLSNTLYCDEIAQLLYSAIEQQNKKDIDSLARIYIRQLINSGYNAQYIYKMMGKIFYQREINNNKDVHTFFEVFNFTNQSYTIYLSIDNEVKEVSNIWSQKLRNIKVEIPNIEKIPKGIAVENGKILISLSGIIALDEYTAFENCREIVLVIYQFYSFYRHKKDMDISKGYVVTEKRLPILIKRNINGFDKSLSPNSLSHSSHSTIKLFDLATTNRKNFYMITRIMQIHDTVLKIDAPSNILLDLWSIFELFLEKDDGRNHDKSRLNTIIDLMLPFLVNSYFEKIFDNIYKDIQLWDVNFTKKYIDGIEIGNSSIERVFCFIVLKDYDKQRNDLYGRLNDFPLLRFRVFILNEQFQNTSKMKSILKTHEERLKWHFHRIYRARNYIVHDCEVVNNIDNLVENLHSYIDIICNKIIEALSTEQHVLTVSDIIFEQGLQKQLFYESITSSKEINKDNYRSILYQKKQ